MFYFSVPSQTPHSYGKHSKTSTPKPENPSRTYIIYIPHLTVIILLTTSPPTPLSKQQARQPPHRASYTNKIALNSTTNPNNKNLHKNHQKTPQKQGKTQKITIKCMFLKKIAKKIWRIQKKSVPLHRF